jgi:oligoendopeptidase F
VIARTGKEIKTMLNGQYFRDQVENIIDNPDSYSREELYTAFLEMTERYLNELISTLNYEKAIIASL